MLYKVEYRRILIPGSAGYLGRIITKEFQQNHSVIPTYRTEAYFDGSHHYDFWVDDIGILIKEHNIDLVIIAASMAYEGTDFALFQRQVERLVRGCQHCRVVYISSDGIFDGKKGNYTESDRVDPVTQYGRNLKCLEEMVQSFCANYCIVRPSYLYGYSFLQLDRRLARLRERLLAGEHLTYFTDMIKSPMEINQVAEAVIQFALSNYVGIVHVAGEAMSVYDFAREAMSSLGISCEHLHRGLMPVGFPHPKNTSLDTSLMKRLTGIEPFKVSEVLGRES